MGSTGKSNNTVLTKAEQLQIILKENPAEDDLHTWIREESDILTFKEALDDVGWDGTWSTYEDFTSEDIQKALDTGKVTVYSSYPIKNGFFVTPSKLEASSYSGNGMVYTATVNTSDIAWIDDGQGQLATKRKIKYSKVKGSPI